MAEVGQRMRVSPEEERQMVAVTRRWLASPVISIQKLKSPIAKNSVVKFEKTLGVRHEKPNFCGLFDPSVASTN